MSEQAPEPGSEQPPTYTLDEAKRLLAEQECNEHGHRWDVVEYRTMADPAGTPTGVVCTTCALSYAVVPKTPGVGPGPAFEVGTAGWESR